MSHPSRREFLKSTVTADCSTGLGVCAASELLAASSLTGDARGPPRPAPLPIKKGLVFDMLPARRSFVDRMKLARDAGFDVVQAPTTPDEREAETIKKAADGANVRVDSVMNLDHWKYPLSSADSAVVEKSLAWRRPTLRNAKIWGSDAVFL